MPTPSIELPLKQLAAFCRRWNIAKLEVFGSAVRNDFRPDSDVDFLATFTPGVERSLLDHVEMQNGLRAVVGREVDLVSRQAVEKSRNWIRRRQILDSAEVLYAA